MNDDRLEDAQDSRGGRPVQLSVVVPVFNERDNIDQLHDRLDGALRPRGRTYELLFIDDGSTDDSFDKLEALHERDPAVRVVRFVRNFGQQKAVAAGLRYARGDVVVLIDADLQTLPEEIPKLTDKLAEGYDIVYGIRERREDPLLRKLGSWCMSHLLYRMTGIDVPDSASGFIALDRRFVDSINLFNEKSSYFSGLFAWLSYGRWAAVPVSHQARQAGRSNYTIPKLIGLALNFVCNFSEMPLRFATYLGGGFVILGTLGLIACLAAHVLASAPSWAGLWALAAAMALFSGVQLLAIGVVGEYLGRVYTEVKQRPAFVVRDILDHGGD
ncbi:MAG: glycosyltransferase family 2 protein [Candidatus Hydrogenedentes bacterium]|nr:glycosyltransferase family 2 protein [Candidatus Hydrogenedentota bacterium]